MNYFQAALNLWLLYFPLFWIPDCKLGFRDRRAYIIDEKCKWLKLYCRAMKCFGILTMNRSKKWLQGGPALSS